MVHVYENDGVCHEVQTKFGSFPLARLIKSSEHIITIYVSRKQTFLTSTRMWKFCKNALTFLCAHKSLLYCLDTL